MSDDFSKRVDGLEDFLDQPYPVTESVGQGLREKFGVAPYGFVRIETLVEKAVEYVGETEHEGVDLSVWCPELMTIINELVELDSDETADDVTGKIKGQVVYIVGKAVADFLLYLEASTR